MEFLLLLGALALLGLAALGVIGMRRHQRAGTVRAVLEPRLGSIRRSDSDDGGAGAAG
jgi:hypothetical protein